MLINVFNLFLILYDLVFCGREYGVSDLVGVGGRVGVRVISECWVDMVVICVFFVVVVFKVLVDGVF